ncbi:hypothetical protein N7495_002994 [Penicillium taxi]|uniref:uncharacterized protein n=1 Tax=Penicillium taxi TaxID=168475 RepID=UPI002544FEF0|nr:uncharacterized protein N7495_002994 [Penicillium taxi]KAJ5902466.1 hypothetical protein N7495_002994 [Penicillium taxi]
MESSIGSPSTRLSMTRARNKTPGSIAKRACDQCKFRKIKVIIRFPPVPLEKPPGAKCPCSAAYRSPVRPVRGWALIVHFFNRRRNEGLRVMLANVSTSSVEPVQPVSLQGSSWAPAHGDASMTVNGAAVLAQSDLSSSSSSIVDVWGTEPASIDSHSTSAVGWNERQDAEYWLPDSFGVQGSSIFEFPGSNIYLKPALPSIIQPTPDVSGMNITLQDHQGMAFHSVVRSIGSMSSETEEFWPASISEANMIPWIDVYFDRLHPTLPLLNHSSIFTRIMFQEHRKNTQFGAMLLSLCAFALTQPIEINEHPTTSSRATQARSMIYQATKMRSCSDFGENPTIEDVLTSLFLFGCLFGSNQHNAAWLRLREALDLASTLGLNDPNTYRDLSGEEKGQRLRIYLVLSITERAYGLQRLHPMTFSGKTGFSMRSVHDFLQNAAHNLVSGIIVHNEHDAEGMIGLVRLMEIFDVIDEDFMHCWHRHCDVKNGFCQKFTDAKVLGMHDILNRLSQSELYKGYDWFELEKMDRNANNAILSIGLRETQAADIFITQKWLQNRIWWLCLNHGLLRSQSERPELTFGYAVSVAESTLQICRSLRLRSMEAHGIGYTEKLYDIAINAINILYNISPPYGTGITPLGSFSGSITPNFNPQSLIEDFMLLMNSFRGGKHPFLQKYKDHLRSLQIPGSKMTGWAQ